MRRFRQEHETPAASRWGTCKSGEKQSLDCSRLNPWPQIDGGSSAVELSTLGAAKSSTAHQSPLGDGEIPGTAEQHHDVAFLEPEVRVGNLRAFAAPAHSSEFHQAIEIEIGERATDRCRALVEHRSEE